MKDEKSGIKVVKSDNFEESKFGIADEAALRHIFDILRNKIYSNKIRAVVREYSTNAMDANIENGKSSTPIEVTLPTQIEPYFTIRDFGKGLSDEDIRNVYVQYGSSTKRDSNLFNGQLGLGSKAGFAYGDSFQVYCYQNGRCRQYEAYIDETEIGAIALLNAMESEEPSGIKIVIPVRTSDFYLFEEEVNNLYRYFTVPPKVNGVAFKDQNQTKPLYSGDDWKIFTVETGYYANPQTIGIMGNVGYPIQIDQIQNHFQEDSISQLAFNIAKAGNCSLQFNIGDLKISASREELSYDKNTIRNIILAYKKLAQELIDLINSELKDQNTDWEKAIYLNSLDTGLFANNNIKQAMKKSVIAKNIGSDSFSLTYKSGKEEYFINKYSSYYHPGDTSPTFNSTRQINQKTFSTLQPIEPTSQTYIFYQDTRDKHLRRALTAIHQLWYNPNTSGYYRRTNRVYQFYLITGANDILEEKEIKALSKQLNIPEDCFIPLSIFEPRPIPQKVGNGYSGKTSTQLKKEKSKVFKPRTSPDGSTYNTAASQFWDHTEIDFSVGGIYTQIDRFIPVGLHSINQFKNLILKAEECLNIDLTELVVGVKSRNIKKFDRSKKWFSLQEFICKLFEEKDLSVETEITNRLLNQNLCLDLETLNKTKNLMTDTELKKRLEQFSKLTRHIQESNSREESHFLQHCEAFLVGHERLSKLQEERIKQEEEINRQVIEFHKLADQYPLLFRNTAGDQDQYDLNRLLSYLEDLLESPQKDHINKYIEFCDKFFQKEEDTKEQEILNVAA